MICTVYTVRRRAGIAHRGVSIAGGVLCASLSISTFAQTAPGQAGAVREVDRGLDEVVVTALRRTENLQKVSAAVTAVSQDDLDKQVTQSLADLNGSVPGLQVLGGNAGKSQIFIRGLITNGLNLTTAATTGYYFNDTPVTTNLTAAAGQAEPSYFDLARVEILRGPQGTLYGSSSMGGTVKLIFNEPELDALNGKVGSTLSNTAYGGWNYDVNGVLNVPIVTDTLAFRVSAYKREMSGYVDRVMSAPGAPVNVPPFTEVDADANHEATDGLRASLLYKLNDALSVKAEVLYQKSELANGSFIDTHLSTDSNLVANHIIRTPAMDKYTLPSLTVNLGLAHADITSNTAYFERVHSDITDFSELSGVYNNGVILPEPNVGYLAPHQFTQEIRATSRDTGAWHWLAGAFYLRNHSTNTQITTAAGIGALYGGSAFGVPIVDDLVFYGRTSFLSTQKAVFGEVSYDILPSLTATVGLRRFQISNESNGVGAGFANGGNSTSHRAQDSEGNTPKFLLSYQVDPDRLVYASATNGFRAGGSNSGVPQSACGGDLGEIGLTREQAATFKPDSVWSYEVGAKTDWADRKLRVNAAIYDIEWQDLQISFYLPHCGAGLIGNGGKARSSGAELELATNPWQGLTLSATASYDKAYLSQDIPFQPGTKGQRLTDVPKFTGAATAEYAFTLAEGMTGFVRAGYKYYGTISQGTVVAENQFVPGYSTLLLGAGVEFKNIKADLFARNVTNERAYISKDYRPVALHLYGGAYPILPRMIGLTLTYAF